MKYKKTKVVNYKQQKDNINILATSTEQIMTDTLTLQDENAC